MRVDEGVLDVLVSEHVHDVKNVFCSMILHSGFPMSQCFEAYLLESWVLEFVCDASSLEAEVVSLMLLLGVAEYLLRVFGQLVQSFRQPAGQLEYSWVAVLLCGYVDCSRHDVKVGPS